jgi:hypothetical protein
MSLNIIEGGEDATTAPAWLARFKTEASLYDDRVMTNQAALIINFLLSEGSSSAKDVARAIDDSWEVICAGLDPDVGLARRDSELEAYVSGIHDITYALAPLIPYDDPKQAALVDLLLELQRLPRRTYMSSTVSERQCRCRMASPLTKLCSLSGWHTRQTPPLSCSLETNTI